jgi:hypothetical protein
MINNNIIELVTNFNYLGCQFGSDRNYDIQNTLQRFNYLCRKIKHTLLNKSQQETILKFYKVLAVPSVLYDRECWTLTKQQLQQTESSEMRFLRSVAGYRRMDKERNTDIKQELNIFNLGEKVKEYQWNYLEYILRMPTY